MGRHKSNSVVFKGADSGSLLVGINKLNMDAVIQVLAPQPPSQEKALRLVGPFVVHSAGIGTYADAFALFLHQETNAEEFIRRGKELGGTFSRMTFPISCDNFRVFDNGYEMQLPEEVPGEGQYREGATKPILVNSYERSPQARRQCITHYGAKCVVCDFDFATSYGVLGAGFIHVHHIVPLVNLRKSYVVDPVRDLRPVCPNCHAMLHARTPALTIEELQAIVTAQQGYARRTGASFTSAGR
jgi:hypothetical protein